jgi:hypothetical protein
MSSDYGHLAQVRDRAMVEPHHPQKLVSVRLDYLDSVLKHHVKMATDSADQKGERAVLAGLLRDYNWGWKRNCADYEQKGN